MKSKEIIGKLIELLSGDKNVSEFYKDHRQWAVTRKQCWDSDRIRIGVIGVTSSGKSTLINALLGCDILSSAVAPSSSQLVTCSYGKKHAAQVYFENGTKIELAGKDFSIEKVSEYSDERKNSKNIKGVKNIEIQSPDFSLSQEVVLIDSPGLDAYGLELHEKLTLETLIPTVDICMYVTTTKTNSDGKAREILNTVSKYDCPLVIIQNMIDAVNPSFSGDKTKLQLIKEHYDRVSKLVHESSIKDKSKVKIVQVSAKNAGNWRMKELGYHTETEITKKQYEESGYESLLKAVNDLLNEKKPEIEQQRLKNIDDRVRILTGDIDSRVSNAPVVSMGTETDYSEMEQNLDRLQTNIVSGLNEIKTEYKKQRSFLEEELEEKLTVAKITQIVNEVNQLVNTTGEKICSIVSNSNSEIQKLGLKLNISMRDFAEAPSFALYRDLIVEKKTTEKSVLADGDGHILAGARSWLGDKVGHPEWGRHYEYKTSIVTDIEATKNRQSERLSQAMDQYEKVYCHWKDTSFQKASKQIGNQIKAEKEAGQERKQKQLVGEKLLELQQGLQQLQKKYQGQISAVKKNADAGTLEAFSSNRKVEQIEVNGISEKLYKFAQKAKQQQHQKVFEELVKEEGLVNYTPVVIGWDQESINDFCWQSGIRAPKVFNLLKDKLTPVYGGHRCYFVLVNTTQFGSAEKQIREAELEKQITEQDYIVWVIQDFVEILGSGDVREAIDSMQEFRTGYLPGIRSINMLNHPNPIYNIVYLEYQYQMPGTIEEEIEFIDRIKHQYREWCDSSVEKAIGKMIRNNKLSENGLKEE